MKHTLIILLTILFLSLPISCLAQQNIVKDAAYYSNFVQNTKLDTYVQVKLHTGEQHFGYILRKYDNHFDLCYDYRTYSIYYFDIDQLEITSKKIGKHKSALRIFEAAVVLVVWPVPFGS